MRAGASGPLLGVLVEPRKVISQVAGEVEQGPGGQAACHGDMTVHFGVIGPVVTGMNVLIGGQPAACMGDLHVCSMFDGPKPHVGGTIAAGSTKVMICNKLAARVGDTTECKGPPGCVMVVIG